jgi:hypothetical protein
MRSPVIVIGWLAFKFARNQRGRDCNLYEANLYRTVNDTRRTGFPQRRAADHAGSGAARRKMMTMDEYLDVAEVWDQRSGEDSCPFEPKACD